MATPLTDGMDTSFLESSDDDEVTPQSKSAVVSPSTATETTETTGTEPPSSGGGETTPPAAPPRRQAPLHSAHSMLSVAIAADKQSRNNRVLRARAEPAGVPVKDFYRALRYLNRRQQLCSLVYYLVGATCIE
jgi:hypothetical protein